MTRVKLIRATRIRGVRFAPGDVAAVSERMAELLVKTGVAEGPDTPTGDERRAEGMTFVESRAFLDVGSRPPGAWTPRRST